MLYIEIGCFPRVDPRNTHTFVMSKYLLFIVYVLIMPWMRVANGKAIKIATINNTGIIYRYPHLICVRRCCKNSKYDRLLSLRSSKSFSMNKERN